MWNRREVLSRIDRCRSAGVPICNYGVTISYTLGIFQRALEPFPMRWKPIGKRSSPDYSSVTCFYPRDCSKGGTSLNL